MNIFSVRRNSSLKVQKNIIKSDFPLRALGMLFNTWNFSWFFSEIIRIIRSSLRIQYIKRYIDIFGNFRFLGLSWGYVWYPCHIFITKDTVVIVYIFPFIGLIFSWALQTVLIFENCLFKLVNTRSRIINRALFKLNFMRSNFVQFIIPVHSMDSMINEMNKTDKKHQRGVVFH